LRGHATIASRGHNRFLSRELNNLGLFDGRIHYAILILRARARCIFFFLISDAKSLRAALNG
jgi:hypothetical protein